MLMANSEKKYIVFAGVNGAGKSTLYYLHPELKDIARVNMDEIARSIGNWSDMSVMFEAGKRAVRLRKRFFAEGISFNQETTLCGHDPLNSIKKAKELGYIVEMHYVGVESVEICKERIRKRVLEGGHVVPDNLVERRYKTSFDNLRKVLTECDKIWLYDNTDEMTLFGIYNNGVFRPVNEKIPRWFSNYVRL